MTTEWTSIITDGLCLDDCVDHEALNRYTTRRLLTDISRIEWQNTRELYVLGADPAAVRFGGVDAGCYTDENSSWVLVVGAGTDQIAAIINRCGGRLRRLDLRFLKLEKLSIHDRLSNLESLRLSPMERLKEVEGLLGLSKLAELDLSFTAMGDHFDVMGLSGLKRLELAGNRALSHIDGLSQLTDLEELDLSGTAIGKELDLSVFQRLKRIRLVDTPMLERIFGLGNNPELTHVDLACSGIKRIPDDAKNLKKLVHLDISHLKLAELPEWLPDLGMSFTYCEDGINLRGTHIHGMDMELFSMKTTEKNFHIHQNRIQQWFEDQKKGVAKSLNELRIVFLGNGGAGKSRIVERLLCDGEQTQTLDTAATLGISIYQKRYQIGDRTVKTHFWDFGGQAILHSMYRLFMTPRTLYVIVLNAREGNQNTQAEYWLHNVKRFADGAPVLLVLNHMDQNPGASVNEISLREIYPKLTDIVRVSALADSKETMNQNLISAIKRQIGKLDFVEKPFPPSWSRLKDHLRAMDAPYIRKEMFYSLCDKNGIENDAGSRGELLQWFDDLGITTSTGERFNDYLILHPDWLTDAIRIILVHGNELGRNGLISRDRILDLLQSEQRVDRQFSYSKLDWRCILDYMRICQLAFVMDEKTVLIPMLCSAQASPVVEEYANDTAAVEFRMVYEYLPRDVIHMLMGQHRQDLDTENIWLTGARFAQREHGLSAVVMGEGDLLRMIVRSERTTSIAQTYVDILMEKLQSINEELGLTVSRKEIAYKAGGTVEYFDYEELLLAQSLEETHVLSRAHKMKIPIPAILMPVSYGETDQQQRLVQDILWSCTMLQNNRIFWSASQDSRNVFIRDLLRAKGYFVADQTLVGVSRSGMRMGELDLDIRLEPGIPWTICETLTVKQAGRAGLKYWEEHLDMLLTNYNPNGLPFMFLIGYVQCSRARFEAIRRLYADHMRYYEPRGIPVLSAERVQTASDIYGERQYIRIFRAVYNTGDHLTSVYHILVHMEDG